MGVAQFMFRSFLDAPSKRRFVRSLILGNRSGDRSVRSADGTKLSVRCSGKGGHPLVVVHGTLDGIGAHSMVELALAERHEVWVYDRRGRGASGDGSDYSIAREIDDLLAVAAATGTVPHVLGHSFGAVVAMQARLRGVEMRSLVLYEPPMNATGITAGPVEEIRSAVEDGRVDEAISAMSRQLAGISEDELGIAMASPPVRNRLRDGVPTAVRELDALRELDWTDLPLAGVPVLVLRGERSTAAAYPDDRQVSELAEDTEVVTLRGQDHLAHVFAPNDYVEHVLNFLGRH